MLSETRERFVKAILQQVPIERIAEIHFFPPIKQGGVESGVAVIAAEPEAQETAGQEVAAAGDGEGAADGGAPADEEPEGRIAMDERAVLESDAPLDSTESVAADDVPAPRYTVYTARYRLVLKGPDRGKWDSAVVAEADAPLVTVDAVVRGVQRRSGEADEPERLSGEELRAAVAAAAPR